MKNLRKNQFRHSKNQHNNLDKDLYLTKGYIWGTILGIVIGGILTFAGFILVILGLSGSIDWIIEIKGIQSKIANASPGVFFSLLGMFILWRYKPKINRKKSHKIEQISIENSSKELRKKPTKQINAVGNISKTSHSIAPTKPSQQINVSKIEPRITFYKEETSETSKLASNQGLNLKPLEKPNFDDILNLDELKQLEKKRDTKNRRKK